MSKSHNLFLLIVVWSFNCFSQQTDTLSLKLQRDDLHDTIRINTHNLISRNLSFITPLEALDHAEKALEKSLKINYQRGVAESYRNLGSIYSYFGSFYLTVTNIQKAIDGYKTLNDSLGLANCYISLGHAYRYLNNVQKEVEFHKLAYEIHRRQGNPERIGVTSHNLGESYLNNKDTAKAKELTLYAIKLNDSIRNIQVLSSCYKVMGKIFLAENNLSEAEMYFQKILSIYDTLKDKSQKIATIEAIIQLGKIEERQKNNLKQEYYLQKAADFVKHYKLPAYTRQVYLDLIAFYSRTNQRRKAFASITYFKTLSDSLSKVEVQDKNLLVAGFTKLYDVEKKNSLLEIKTKLQSERAKRKNYIVGFSIGFAIITIVLICLLYVNWRKIRKANKLLEQQNLIIEDQNEKLEELNRTKDKFFGIVSHDLRAPLSAVSSFTNFMLSDRLADMPKDQLQELLAESKMLIDNTQKLTTDLITWAKIQMKKEQTHPGVVTVSDIIYNVLSVFAERAAQKQIEVTTDTAPDLTVFADSDQLQFILRNLVNNAIKFTHSGGKVNISSRASGNDSVLITVTDNGMGIAPEILQSIFKVGKNKGMIGTAGEVGTGLGLILVQEFVLLNKGEVSVTSELKKGSSFSIILPAVQN